MSHPRSIPAQLRSCVCLLAALAAIAVPAAAQDEETTTITGARPLSPQPAPGDVKPGLAVQYLYGKFDYLSEMRSADVDPVPGEPISELDTVTETDPATGEDKIVEVLTSDQTVLVGALIRGMIRFPEAGDYTLRVKSNDGVQMWIGGAMIWEDPAVHFDRMSPPLALTVPEAGWYEFKTDYYQKKGTWALQLLWTRPGGGEPTPVPPEAFGHLD